MACKKNHNESDSKMEEIPCDQGGVGRHKCAACAYEQGFEDGKQRKEIINLGQLFNSLDESQQGEHRHKSPHAAYALGYFDGVEKSYSD